MALKFLVLWCVFINCVVGLPVQENKVTLNSDGTLADTPDVPATKKEQLKVSEKAGSDISNDISVSPPKTILNPTVEHHHHYESPPSYVPNKLTQLVYVKSPFGPYKYTIVQAPLLNLLHSEEVHPETTTIKVPTTTTPKSTTTSTEAPEQITTTTETGTSTPSSAEDNEDHLKRSKRWIPINPDGTRIHGYEEDFRESRNIEPPASVDQFHFLHSIPQYQGIVTDSAQVKVVNNGAHLESHAQQIPFQHTSYYSGNSLFLPAPFNHDVKVTETKQIQANYQATPVSSHIPVGISESYPQYYHQNTQDNPAPLKPDGTVAETPEVREKRIEHLNEYYKVLSRFH